MSENLLYYGDNLDILRQHIQEDTVDLIYLDPPFQSNKVYNVLFEEKNGTKSKSQMKAFEDTWSWDQESSAAFESVVESGGQIAKAMLAFRTTIGENDMLAYLSMMAPRLIELRRVLKSTGSIYLHCDPTASHYLKILMDAVYGSKNFRNEIIWHYKKWSTGKYTFQRNHDILLFYSNSLSKKRVFNQLYMPRAESTLKRFGTAKIKSGYDEKGNRIPSQMESVVSPGVRQDDVWDISRVPPIKQLFPTQKPEALLERILLASSNEGDIVLDPFCGCGTSVFVAQELGRKWVGIDITYLAISVIKRRLYDTFGDRSIPKVIGEPVSVPDAKILAKQDPYQFQWWSLDLVGARPTEQKKGADRGIDGRLYFHEGPDKNRETKQIILQIKAGKTSVSHVRDLRGVIERESADIGTLITMNKPTKPMISEAASAGFYKSRWGNHPRIQLLTIEDLLNGRTIDYPAVAGSNITFKKATKFVKSNPTKPDLFDK